MKLRFLDALRGWGALTVVLNHFCFVFLPFAINEGGTSHAHTGELLIHNTPLYLFVDGDFAVCIFFILSGIVLSASYLRRQDDAKLLGSAAKRYFRLMIPAFGSVMMVLILLATHHLYNHQVSAATGSPWWDGFWSYPASLGHAISQGVWGSWLGGANTYNPVLWTMALELFGSFLVFGCLYLFSGLPRRWAVYGILICLLWKSYFVNFIFGLAIADIYFRDLIPKIRSYMGTWPWTPLLMAGLLLGSMPFGPLDKTIFAFAQTWLPPYQLQTVAHTFGALLVLMALMTSPLLQRALSNRVSRFMGRISFSLYLTHFVILASYSGYLFLAIRYSHGYRASVVITFIPTLILAVTFAYLYAKYVDEPAIRLSNRFGSLVTGLVSWRFKSKTTKASATKAAPGPAPTTV